MVRPEGLPRGLPGHKGRPTRRICIQEPVRQTPYEAQRQGFEDLLGLTGVAPKTIRALALIGELLYRASPSFCDPARYSFTHGGKDGHPYSVDRRAYSASIDFLQKAPGSAKIGPYDKVRALRRLYSLYR